MIIPYDTVGGQPVDIQGIFLMPVVADLVEDVQQDHYGTGHPYGETGNVYY